MCNILLIADNQPYLKQNLNEAFSVEGNQFEHVKKTDEIEETIQTFNPDLVLFDLYFKGTERWDILQDIKWLNPRLPILILSPYESFLNDERAALADGYISSWVHKNILKKKIQSTLNKFL